MPIARRTREERNRRAKGRPLMQKTYAWNIPTTSRQRELFLTGVPKSAHPIQVTDRDEERWSVVSGQWSVISGRRVSGVRLRFGRNRGL